MDLITLQRIRKAHPRIRKFLEEQYKDVNKKLPEGVRLRFSHVYRTPEEQEALFKQVPKVTNARAWQSVHNYGLAFDIVILIDKDKNGTFETAVWSGFNFDFVVKYFKAKGWEWGGDWKSFKDRPHFQMTFGNTTKNLKSLIDTGKYIEEKGIKYPLL
jgi:peptidoglycan L-alanyl-D-glutamate endopeptidase CwlK